MSREWKLYFDDLLGFGEKVTSYMHGLTREKLTMPFSPASGGGAE